ncbi:hypothetical protein [Stackebrandtia nassauensis]|nr:hypothetical protein [Stackebrandtia nassauensis]
MSVTNEELRDLTDLVHGTRQSVSNDQSDESAVASAAANLCSGMGEGLLYAPTELNELVKAAIETGYRAALTDIRNGKVEGFDVAS